jgi:hypothetical protein
LPSPTTISRARASRSPALADFDRFWAVYPRKVGKGAAEKSWVKALTVASPGEIITAAQRNAWPDDPQFIPNPATWLNQQRWLDEAPEKKPSLMDHAMKRLKEAEEEEAHEQASSDQGNYNYLEMLPPGPDWLR